jgi:DNA-binding transcriptional ArsR family regulator
MELTFDVDVADLAATRFATSPLMETILAVQVLADPRKSAVNLPWVRWARAQLDAHDQLDRPLRLPRLRPLIITGRHSWPEWLAPAPGGRRAVIDEELASILATPPGRIEASLRRVFGDTPWPASATGLIDDPAASLTAITAELRDCHDRLVAPHWERIQAVLDADIAYRTAGSLASGGARTLFNDLHPRLRWSGGKLTLADDGRDTRPARTVLPAPDGLVLLPSVFIWPSVAMKLSTTTQTTLRYPARGAAALWEADASCPPAIEALLGAPRARLLSALRSPASPSSLAARLGVTPSAVSQHLAVLFRSGLADRQRSGRQVLYRASDLGLALLNGSRDAGRNTQAF